MTPKASPPTWIESLLAACLPVGEVRDGIVGDLREDFSEVATGRGRPAATIWYALQAIRIGARYGSGRTLKALTSRASLGTGPGIRTNSLEGSTNSRGRKTNSQGGMTNSQGGMMMDDVWRDIRLVFRAFAKSPGFFLVAIMTLALGIGANTAIFSVVNGILLKPLPFEDPDALVGVWHATRGGPVSAVAGMDEGLYFTYRDENLQGMSCNDPGAPERSVPRGRTLCLPTYLSRDETPRARAGAWRYRMSPLTAVSFQGFQFRDQLVRQPVLARAPEDVVNVPGRGTERVVDEIGVGEINPCLEHFRSAVYNHLESHGMPIIPVPLALHAVELR